MVHSAFSPVASSSSNPVVSAPSTMGAVVTPEIQSHAEGGFTPNCSELIEDAKDVLDLTRNGAQAAASSEAPQATLAQVEQTQAKLNKKLVTSLLMLVGLPLVAGLATLKVQTNMMKAMGERFGEGFWNSYLKVVGKNGLHLP